MAKSRIYELAKELNVPAKDIITYLAGKGIEVSNHMSSIDEKDAMSVKKAFSDKKKSSEEPKKAASQEEGQKPKKKMISAVFNPQNSKNGNRNQKSIVKGRSSQQEKNGSRSRRERGQGGGGMKRQQSGRPQAGTRVPLRKPTIKYDSVQPGSATSVDNSSHALQKNRSEAANHGEKNSQAKAETRKKNGEKRPNSERTQGGDRRENQERKKQSVSKSSQGSRGNSASRTGGRRGGQNDTDRAKTSRGGADRRNGSPAAASAPDGNGRKDSRDRGRKHQQNYDKKPKRQERYVNLEKKTGHKKKNAVPVPASEKRDKNEIISIKVPDYITIHDLADRMHIQPSDIIKKLFLAGQVVTMNQEIDYEKAEEIALDFNCICEKEEKVDVIAELLKEEEEPEKDLKKRPPVVCVMGHVDHGKTSLLDAIRQTHVTDREAGGITQHIGASVATINGEKITFLDTPGHEAFTAMRMRGAKSTDIAILVVAADDGIMPQTIEAINHAKAAGIEVIVAINKIDKPGANIDLVKQGLAEQGLIPEDWGGSTICVPVSAKTHEGIDELLEMILLTADVLELKANPKRKARGLVIEAKIDKGRGVVATVLIQKGTLKQGEPVAAGACYGKARALTDHTGKRVKEAGPSMPVEIIGLNNIPHAGEVFMAFDSEKEARNFAETFVSNDKEKLLEETRARRNLDNIFSQIQAGNLKELELIVKADVQGSVEAVRESLEKLSNDEVVVKVIHGGVGVISESDVNLASASNAVIIGFNVKTDSNAKSIAEHENVEIRTYSVIYKAIEDVENAMKGMLEPIYEEKVIGHAEVRQLFKASGVGTIAGSYVLDGVFERDCKIRIRREGEQIYEGALASLKRFKDDVKSVKAGYECGLVFDGFNELREGDEVEAYKMVEVPRQ
ncbi:MAG: translation initiation factor IF-2 [Eubacterium sp.]|jgi:translation initiation factor IF-2